jgi:chloramphenicol 3-O phosphotransferase
MERKGSIILLNGASSAGKSTLATAIQAAADQPFLRFSLDFFFFGNVLPRRGDGAFAWPPVRERLVAGYYNSLAAFAHAGSDLVVDHIFEDRKDFEDVMAALCGLDVFIVGVHCPIEELERRERERADRPAGDARRDLETVHTFCVYDFEVDSTKPAEGNAQRILEAWQERN